MTDAQDGRAQAEGQGEDPATRPAPAPRPLTPSRPWEDRSEGPRHAAPAPPSSPGTSPVRPWARGPEQIESPPLDDPDVQDELAPGLAPIRPWRGERPAGSLPPQAPPRPSNPDVVLQGMAGELASERPVETDDERRRRFARQHAAADAARLAALPPALDELGPPPSSYEPDPAVYDVPGALDEGPRRRRFNLRRRGTEAEGAPADVAPVEVAPVEGAPVEVAPSVVPPPASYAPEPVVAEPVLEPVNVPPVDVEPVDVPAVDSGPGPLGKAVRWLMQRSPEPAQAPPVAVDVTDAPALDLELADEFHGEPAAPTAEPVPEHRPAAVTRPRRGLARLRRTRDEEEGPFFPPETTASAGPSVPSQDAGPAPTLDLPTVASVLDDVPLPAASEVPAVPVSRNRPRPRPRPPVTTEPPAPPSADTVPPAPEQPAPARQRPRPRPAAARAAASPAAETSTEPDPAGHRSPDISRFLAATEPQPGDNDPEPKEPMRRRRRIRGSRGLRIVTQIGIAAAVAFVAAVLLRVYVVAPFYIPSGSMEQTLHGGSGTNDHILVDKITYRIHDPHQGDIVVFDRPDTWKVPDKVLVKRIIGLPGDRVQLKNGLVYVNGQRLTENYLDKDCPAPVTRPLNGTSRWTVPMADYFVMGDNRCDSDDSRMYGPVPQSKIVGRAFLIIWPLSRFGTP